MSDPCCSHSTILFAMIFYVLIQALVQVWPDRSAGLVGDLWEAPKCYVLSDPSSVGVTSDPCRVLVKRY